MCRDRLTRKEHWLLLLLPITQPSIRFLHLGAPLALQIVSAHSDMKLLDFGQFTSNHQHAVWTAHRNSSSINALPWPLRQTGFRCAPLAQVPRVLPKRCRTCRTLLTQDPRPSCPQTIAQHDRHSGLWMRPRKATAPGRRCAFAWARCVILTCSPQGSVMQETRTTPRPDKATGKS